MGRDESVHNFLQSPETRTPIRCRHSSLWPILLLMLFWVAVLLGFLLGRALLLMLPVLVAGLAALIVPRWLRTHDVQAVN